MSLLAYNLEEFDLEGFSNKCKNELLQIGYTVEHLGWMTNVPGVLFELGNISEISDACLEDIKSIFLSLGGKNISININNIDQTIIYSVEKSNVSKPSLFLNLYKYTPSLPIMLFIVLCLYKYNKDTIYL
tara:strand:+ start:642 stop:1031 length:390 start_codon:yes stop_codon:yes gene_type:complete